MTQQILIVDDVESNLLLFKAMVQQHKRRSIRFQARWMPWLGPANMSQTWSLSIT
jgi:CheY-like chemotaxis protein